MPGYVHPLYGVLLAFVALGFFWVANTLLLTPLMQSRLFDKDYVLANLRHFAAGVVALLVGAALLFSLVLLNPLLGIVFLAIWGVTVLIQNRRTKKEVTVPPATPKTTDTL